MTQKHTCGRAKVQSGTNLAGNSGNGGKQTASGKHAPRAPLLRNRTKILQTHLLYYFSPLNISIWWPVQHQISIYRVQAMFVSVISSKSSVISQQYCYQSCKYYACQLGVSSVCLLGCDWLKSVTWRSSQRQQRTKAFCMESGEAFPAFSLLSAPCANWCSRV